ncbi:carboxyl transferase domain-containing protein [Kocuria rhizophila]|nr:carboxyl transferase domain-containing protein [Kocuria rhizophila]
MFITRPDVIETSDRRDQVDMETLGGARSHDEHRQAAAYLASDRPDAFDFVHELLEYLPGTTFQDSPLLDRQVERGHGRGSRPGRRPDSADRPFSMRTVVERVVDGGQSLQIQELCTERDGGCAQVEGHTMGIVGEPGPVQFAGTWTSPRREGRTLACTTAAPRRPSSRFVDVRIPAGTAEFDGIIRRGAKLAVRLCRGPPFL